MDLIRDTVRSYAAEHDEVETRAFVAGMIAGFSTVAHWSDGIQYVGKTGKTLEAARLEATAALEEVVADDDVGAEDLERVFRQGDVCKIDGVPIKIVRLSSGSQCSNTRDCGALLPRGNLAGRWPNGRDLCLSCVADKAETAEARKTG